MLEHGNSGSTKVPQDIAGQCETVLKQCWQHFAADVRLNQQTVVANDVVQTLSCSQQHHSHRFFAKVDHSAPKMASPPPASELPFRPWGRYTVEVSNRDGVGRQYYEEHMKPLDAKQMEAIVTCSDKTSEKMLSAILPTTSLDVVLCGFVASSSNVV